MTEGVAMRVLGASAIAGALVTLEALVSYAMAAKLAELPSPKRTGECVRYDNLPPVCGFRNVFLTDAQSKVILSYQHQNLGAFTKAAKSAIAAAPPQIPSPEADSRVYTVRPPSAGLPVQGCFPDRRAI
jgi:hypothetical protein